MGHMGDCAQWIKTVLVVTLILWNIKLQVGVQYAHRNITVQPVTEPGLGNSSTRVYT